MTVYIIDATKEKTKKKLGIQQQSEIGCKPEDQWSCKCSLDISTKQTKPG